MVLYAMILLLVMSYIGMNSLKQSSVFIDVLNNHHNTFQASLYTQSIANMAKICLEKYDFNPCESDRFIFENFIGGYDLIKDDTKYYAEIYVEAKNLRTSQNLRATTKILLKEE